MSTTGMGSATTSPPGNEPRLVLPGRVVGAGEGVAWIGEGWRLFLKAPFMWILAMLVSLVIVVVLHVIPFIGSIASMFLEAILFAGFMVASHSLARGGDFELEHLFAGFKKGLGNLVIFALVMLACTIAIFAVTFGFIAVTVGVTFLTQGGEDMAAALAASGLYIVAACLLALALILPLTMAYWFSPALIVLNDLGAGGAMKASFVACLRNFLPFLVYGFVMMLLCIVAAIPLGLGMLVWVPLLFTSTYAAYRSIFTEPAPAAG